MAEQKPEDPKARCTKCGELLIKHEEDLKNPVRIFIEDEYIGKRGRYVCKTT